ncbi:MAG: beta-N-acetylhexosaminidase [Steroidobacteraceae bacterium]
MRNGASLGAATGAAVQAAAVALGATLSLGAHGGVIPLPAEIVPGSGYFSVDAGTRLRVAPGDRAAGDAARYLVALWARTNGLTVPVSIAPLAASDSGAQTIAFRHQNGFAPEGYGIEVAAERITVSASSAAGLFYGAVTLWQLLPPGTDAGRIPVQTIRDAPIYRWRGLMLDSSRHFQSPAFVRSMIDWMAWHKLNVLHWHLTDDQGWRLEIRKYPRLTSVGAWRVEPDGTRYGGFYTQDEVGGIVRFAASRHVQIVPEIDMPGHATAAIAAYPALGAALAEAGAPAPAVSARWGTHTRLLNLDAATFRFLEDVLAEVIEIFPGPAVHIGGDEVVADEWTASPEVQARARQLGLNDPGDLQAYFTQRIGRYLAAHARRIIGWDEILRPGLRQDAIVMSWHGIAGAHRAAAAGNDTILAPDPALYFDHRQSTLPAEPPGRLQVISLEDVYRFEPHDATLDVGQQSHVLGVQGNLWTEHIKTAERLQWMALPRAAALAEVGWSAAPRRRWTDFLERLVPMLARYRAFGLNYADSVFAPGAAISPAAAGFTVRLSNQARNDAASGRIRYTLDGREPSAESTAYDTPLTVAVGTELRAAAFAGTTQASRTAVLLFDASSALRRDSHELELCTDGVGLLLEPAGAAASLAVDIMNPCWIEHGVDLSAGPRLTAAVAALPFNFELGADAAKIRLGEARTAEGELEVHVDGCETLALAVLPLAAAAHATGITTLPAQRLPRIAGRHDLCLRFARPHRNPLWALDWIEIGE